MMLTLGFGRTLPGKIVLGCMGFLIGMCSRLSAAVLLIAGLPVMGVLYLLHLATNRDGGPFLYKGVRLGKDKRLLTIYKIRTLVVNAESRLQGKLHTGNAAMETPMGGFLRKTRLDELPQLLNILRGEMAFVGPRSERPSVYESICRHIPGYDRRFLVKPGLTGLSQFLTPHGASKRLRTRIDAMLLKKMRNPFWRVYILLWTVGGVAMKVAGEGVRVLRNMVAADAPPPVMLSAFDHGHRREHVTLLKLKRLNRSDMAVTSESRMQRGQVLHLRMYRRCRRKLRSARCRAIVIGPRTDQGGDRTYVVQYEPLSQRHEYLLERYILRMSLA